jgi:hypothetical protein
MAEEKANENKEELKPKRGRKPKAEAKPKEEAPKVQNKKPGRMLVEFTEDHQSGFKKGEKKYLKIRNAEQLILLGLAKKA